MEEPPAVHVLFVGDEATGAALERRLGEAADRVSVTVATPLAAALDRLDESVDCVVFDATAAVDPPLAALERVRERDGDVPFALLGEVDLDAFVAADRLGEVAAVVRSGPDLAGRLADRVRHAATDRRELTELRRTRARYDSLVAQTPVPILRLRADGSIEFANDAAAAFFGVDDRDALVGRAFGEFVPPDDRSVVRDRIARVVEDGTPIPRRQMALRDDASEVKWATVAARPVTDGAEPLVQFVLTDITEHKRLGARLRSELDRFAALFENLSEPVVETRFTDTAPVVERANSAFVETFGVPRDEAVGRSLDALIVPAADRERADEFNRRARAGERLDVEVRRETTDGTRDFLLRYVPFETDDAVRGYAIYIDITDRRAWERQLERHNERLEEVARVVSHDLRNPLNVASGTTEVLAEVVDETHRDHIERLERAHDRMEAIITDMLTLARQGKAVSDLRPVSLPEAARDAWDTVDAPAATLVVETDATVRADGSRLRAVFENLFANAVTHGRPDATVTVGDVETDADATPEAASAPVRRWQGFFVADDGPGVPEDDREWVFESGNSTADGNTGFGLGIVQSVVEAHGWEAAVTESASGGARFEVTGVERTG